MTPTRLLPGVLAIQRATLGATAVNKYLPTQESEEGDNLDKEPLLEMMSSGRTLSKNPLTTLFY
jgi:hypothetical protein